MKTRIIAGITLALFGLGAGATLPGKGYGAIPQAKAVTPVILQDRTPGTIPLADVNEAFKILAGSPNGAADDRFGRSVSISGDSIVIGAPTDDSGSLTDAGSVYVFIRSGATWQFQAKINPPVPEQNAGFGSSVAISGNSLVVGAPLTSTVDGANSGAVFVYTRSGSTWTLQQDIDPANRTAGDRFGASVDIEGDSLIAGGSTADSTTAQVGAAWVFTRSGSVWTQQQRLLASDGATADNFGNSVAISGDSAIVGASFARVSALDAAGAAYVFTRTAGVWSQQQKLVAPVAGELDEYGTDVDIEGDRVIVGNRNEDSAQFANSGAALVYRRTTGVWTLEATLVAADAAENDFFGISVALNGPHALVGAYTEDRTGLLNAGAAYLFERNGSNAWAQNDKYIASDAGIQDELGFDVALAPGFGVVGAPLDDNADGVDAGAVYVFDNGTPTSSVLAASGNALTYGETLQLTSTVSPAGATGTVNFLDGALSIGSDVLDGAGQADVALVPAAGNHAYVANYLGDGTFLPSTSNTQNVTVAKAATSLVLNATAVSQPYGTPVSFTATLSETAVGGLPPTGSIVFRNNATVLGTVALSGGQAVLTRNDLAVGSYSVTAEYAGDTNFLASSAGPVAYTVTRATVAINVTSSPNPAARNSNQTFTATFTGGIPVGNVALQALPLPSGTAIDLGSPAIVSGVASIVDSSLPVGSYTIRAIYTGDANHFLNITDSAVPHVVTPSADLSITKTNGITFINEGSQVTYTITVTNPAGNDAVQDARVNDNVNAAFFDDSAVETSWTCVAGPNANCDTANGTGDIVNLLVDLDPGSSVVITLVTRCRAEGNEFPNVSNTATVAAPVGITDPNLANNSATDSDPSGMFRDGFED